MLELIATQLPDNWRGPLRRQIPVATVDREGRVELRCLSGTVNLDWRVKVHR